MSLEMMVVLMNVSLLNGYVTRIMKGQDFVSKMRINCLKYGIICMIYILEIEWAFIVNTDMMDEDTCN